ncbi:hypothetical protein [Catellatospora sp. NPDC049609]|uniref:hypothetical protein n=1 Tax=Catellatospora sp. NPDC049609 TaxID=3155505 RepID=UPI00344448CD
MSLTRKEPADPGKPDRERSDQRRYRIGRADVDRQAIMAAVRQVALDVDDGVHACFAEDLLDPDGLLPRDYPVACFEPCSALLAASPGGAPREVQVESAIALGLRRWQGSGVLGRVGGWLLRRAARGLELLTPDGSMFSRGELALPPRWISEAMSVRRVLVLYGPWVGVRPPQGCTDDGQYTARARRDELRQAQRKGMVAAGVIAFAGRP